MRSNLPASHLAQAFELTTEAYQDLFRIDFNNGIILGFTAKKSITWYGMNFESIPVNLTEEGTSTQGESKRPKFSCANPDSLFSAYVFQGLVDAATFTRYRVLTSDASANNPIYQQHVWRHSKTISLTKSLVVFELRSALDGPQFLLPGRAFFPPEYPHVTL